VIFLHGIAAESATWRAVFHEISQDHSLQNVRLVALDLLGFGKSLHAGWLDYDYYDYITAINHTIKHLKISSPVVLVGHSMGAQIMPPAHVQA
jgi:pimeloyl-ACP methyl ester carboxylesterase